MMVLKALRKGKIFFRTLSIIHIDIFHCRGVSPRRMKVTILSSLSAGNLAATLFIERFSTRWRKNVLIISKNKCTHAYVYNVSNISNSPVVRAASDGLSKSKKEIHVL